MRGLNVGSGGRRFDLPWVNCDRVLSTHPHVCCDGIALPFPDECFEVVVLWHVIEHFGREESDALLRECNRVLKPGGRFIAAVPDIRQLAKRYLVNQMDEALYTTNIYGPWAGHDEDRHKQGWSQQTFLDYVRDAALWASVRVFGGYPQRPEGTDLNLDWWMASVEAIK